MWPSESTQAFELSFSTSMTPSLCEEFFYVHEVRDFDEINPFLNPNEFIVANMSVVSLSLRGTGKLASSSAHLSLAASSLCTPIDL